MKLIYAFLLILLFKFSLSELVEGLDIYPQVLINIKVTDKAKAQKDPKVVEAVKAVENELGDSGRILVRESGTEPLVRVMVEAKSQAECEKLARRVIDVIKEQGYEDNNIISHTEYLKGKIIGSWIS